MSVRFVLGTSVGNMAVLATELAAGLVAIQVLTHALTRSDFGVMLLIANGAGAINLLFTFSVAQALTILYAAARDEGARRSVCTTILLSTLSISLALHLCAAALSSTLSRYFVGSEDFAGVISLGMLASFLDANSLCLLSVVRMRELHRYYQLVQVAAIALRLMALLWLVLRLQIGLAAPYLAMSLAGAFTTMAYAMIIRRSLSGPVEPATLARAAAIAVRVMPWQLAYLLTTSTAGFFLARAGQLAEAGLFAVAAAAAAPLLAASNSFGQVWTPFVLLRRDEPGLAATQLRIFALFSSLLLLAAAALALFARELLAVLVSPSFWEAHRLVPMLALAYCLLGFANNFAQGLQARQRTIHYSWIGVVTAAVFLGLCAALVRAWGAWGILTAMTVSFATMLVCLQLVSYRLMPVAYPWLRHAGMWLSAALIGGLASRLELSWQSAGLKLAALGAIAGLPLLFGAIRLADIRAALASVRPAAAR
jgi:O-antigen/teichoic acid export membrane protein